MEPPHYSGDKDHPWSFKSRKEIARACVWTSFIVLLILGVANTTFHSRVAIDCSKTTASCSVVHRSTGIPFLLYLFNEQHILEASNVIKIYLDPIGDDWKDGEIDDEFDNQKCYSRASIATEDPNKVLIIQLSMSARPCARTYIVDELTDFFETIETNPDLQPFSHTESSSLWSPVFGVVVLLCATSLAFAEFFDLSTFIACLI